MKKYFYDLWFVYGNNNQENFHIGYFSTIKKVREIIDVLKNKPGFQGYSASAFQYKRLGVEFPDNIISESPISLFVPSHEYDDENCITHWIIFGVFSTRAQAEQEIEMQKKKKSYQNREEVFLIAEWIVDKSIEWKEGFVST
ncbi:MAG: hypothetical protein KH382_07015 [Clostridiales bacterium]|nr:hypothetical protein [Clostridiales bacterium]